MERLKTTNIHYCSQPVAQLGLAGQLLLASGQQPDWGQLCSKPSCAFPLVMQRHKRAVRASEVSYAMSQLRCHFTNPPGKASHMTEARVKGQELHLPMMGPRQRFILLVLRAPGGLSKAPPCQAPPPLAKPLPEFLISHLVQWTEPSSGG